MVHFSLYEANKALLLTGALLGVYLVISIIKEIRRISKLPPGPRRYPILGYFPLLSGTTYLKMYQLYQKYGDIFSFKLGFREIVVISDPDLIKEAFMQYSFSGRPYTPLYKLFNGFGVLNTRGKMWKDERRFLHQRLSNLGMKKFGAGREQMENKIQIEVLHFLGNLLNSRGSPLNIDAILTAVSTNVITNFLMSKRYNANDPIFLSHKELNGEGFKLFADLDLVNYIWILRFWPSHKLKMKKLAENHSKSMQFYKDVIKERRETRRLNDDNDVLDSYLAVENERQGTIMNFDDQVAQVLCDLVSAGGESVKTTCHWIIIHLLHRPDVLEKMRDEIDQHVGMGRLPEIKDKANLVYCQAVINEVMRISNVVPIAPNHATESDVVLNGYHISKGTSIIAFLYACHMSPKFWDKPEEFRPERFIDGDKLVVPGAFIPFGKGQRVCLGDTMAEVEIFLVTIGLLQNFDITNPPNRPLPSKEGIAGATLCPPAYETCFTVREKAFVQHPDFGIQTDTLLRPATVYSQLNRQPA